VHYSLLRPTALQCASLPTVGRGFAGTTSLLRTSSLQQATKGGRISSSHSVDWTIPIPTDAVRDFLSGSATATSDRASAQQFGRASIVSREDRNVRKKASNERPRNVQDETKVTDEDALAAKSFSIRTEDP